MLEKLKACSQPAQNFEQTKDEMKNKHYKCILKLNQESRASRKLMERFREHPRTTELKKLLK